MTSHSGATADLYDLAWSPDAAYIISACTDNTTRIFDVKERTHPNGWESMFAVLKGLFQTERCIHVLNDHSHFVQGVAWDPLGKYFVSQSSDR